MTTRQLASPTRAHPRSRGENPFCAVMRISWLGSSPLTRGKRFTGCESLGSFGLIPAHAGKTSTRPCGGFRARAHPHSRRENPATARRIVCQVGSSPLTRGKPHPPPRNRGRRGLIPTHAGKTDQAPAGSRTRWAHPRSRGENVAVALSPSITMGSSPLTRGKCHDPGPELPCGRLIPTHAGKT